MQRRELRQRPSLQALCSDRLSSCARAYSAGSLIEGWGPGGLLSDLFKNDDPVASLIWSLLETVPGRGLITERGQCEKKRVIK